MKGWNGIYIQDDPRLFGVNIKPIADNFVNMVKTRSAWYLFFPYNPIGTATINC